MKRNLYYFLCPMGDVWRWNVARLKAHWPIFTGKKVITIATGDGLASPDTVMKCFDWAAVKFIVFPNAPALGETASFLEGLAEMESVAEDEATFYGHAKGVSHKGENLKHVQTWTDAMYVLNLSSPPLVDNLLARYHAIGCYRQRMPHAGSMWHYSGTFFWFRNRPLFSRQWRDIQMERHGTEAFLGRHFSEQETFELTPFVSHWQLYRYPPEEAVYSRWLKELIRKEIGQHGKKGERGVRRVHPEGLRER